MKIAIDISQVVYKTGVGRYTTNLIKNLKRIDKKNDYLLFGGSLRKYFDLKSSSKNYDSKIFPLPPTIADFIWNRLHILPVENLIGKIDVFHSSDWTQPRTSAFKVTTIHDLSPLLFPEFTDPKVVSVHKRRLAWVKREVDRIIVPTEAMATDLIGQGFNKDKIYVIYEGVDPTFAPKTHLEVERLKRKMGITKKYLLGIGVNKRKNTDRIIKAYRSLNQQDLVLILVGHRYSAVKVSDGVIFTGHVKDNDLAVLYSGAEALVYPSLYEGFGLPILEAFACGTPVVTSNLSSMTEIAGNAAVLVNPENIESIALGIKKAQDNRESLIRKGKTRVKKFSWERCAKETLRVYHEVLR